MIDFIFKLFTSLIILVAVIIYLMNGTYFNLDISFRLTEESKETFFRMYHEQYSNEIRDAIRETYHEVNDTGNSDTPSDEMLEVIATE